MYIKGLNLVANKTSFAYAFTDEKQQAISVTTTVLTATSFIDACAHLNVKASLVRPPTPLTAPTRSPGPGGVSSTLAYFAKVVISFNMNLSHILAAAIRAIIRTNFIFFSTH